MRGTVTKRGNKWYIIYQIGIGPDGKRKQKWESGFQTKKQAEEALAKRIVEVSTNTYVEPSSQPLAEFIEAWVLESNLKYGRRLGGPTNGTFEFTSCLI